MNSRKIIALVLLMSLTYIPSTYAERVSDIRNTRHNFSASILPVLPIGEEGRRAAATSETQVCVFCHTPHGGTASPNAPIWNRKMSSASYVTYSSGSMDATDLGQPGGRSKLCLSCHDGTIALGSVNVLNRVENTQINMQGTLGNGTIPEGLGSQTGFTRRIGADLTNDHPISFTFDSSQALRDGELRDPQVEPALGERKPGVKPLLPLDDNKVECVSCHDPHIRDTSGENIKFLRVNRFQENKEPVEGPFNEDNDIICLGCHDKAGWVGSAHANELVANKTYSKEASAIREFPDNIQVWQAACLNCHDPHTVQGSRRILRGGTDGPTMIDPKTGGRYKQGGSPAIEEVCYACHTTPGESILSSANANEVPDIKTDFTTMAIHMPITSADQPGPAGVEAHDIGTGGIPRSGIDFVESRQSMGKGNLSNRHVECTDCHNPHRVQKNRLFNADNTFPDEAGTHMHKPGVKHNNLASGVLRGISGVEPIYGSTDFNAGPVSYEVKRGDPGVNGSTAVAAPHVTREYQICMKCHSSYAFDEPPALGSFSGGTPVGTNGLTSYTDIAREYQSPDSHTGEGTAPGWATNNHRSWHPVMKATGRTAEVRRADANNWIDPFNQDVGRQTMYCTDCHGSSTAAGTVVPNGNNAGEHGLVWGPHGSNDNFLLKGPWFLNSGTSGTGFGTPGDLCFKCHEYNQYGAAAGPVKVSGYGTATFKGWWVIAESGENLHRGHNIPFGGVWRCMKCHISIPHGWKNKVFLANLRDIGLEAPLLPGEGTNPIKRQVLAPYTNPPYYNNAILKIFSFSRSGQWTPGDCGGFGWMDGGDGCFALP